MPPMIFAILLLALVAWALYTAPALTVSVAVGLGIVAHPHVTAWTGATLAVLVIATGLAITWRELRASGWRLVTIG